MDSCEYENFVQSSGIEISGTEKSWKPLLRQCMICTGVWYIYFMQGLFIGAPTVLIAQIRREANSTEAVTDEMSSWLSSTPVISSLPLILIFPWCFQRIGRKFTHLTICIICLIGYIIFYMSTSLIHIIISQVFIGASFVATNSYAPIIIAEYTSPKYRGIFLTVKSVSPFWGIWIANIMGTFFHWKNIAIISFICSVYIITLLIWPESPHWLAMKGRYIECSKSYRWLKGVNVNSEKELAQLIISQKQSRNNSTLPSDVDGCWCFPRMSSVWSTITSRSFYKPALICILLFAQYQFTGKLVIAIYAIEVLKKLTHDESVAYKSMLILDGITVISMYLGCILSRYFKRRILLFSFSCIGNVFLYAMSFYLYLISLFLLQENHVVIIFLLSVFSIATGCGPMILASSIYGEIIPSHYQSPIMTIVGLNTVAIMSVLFKISPFMFKTLRMHGCFLFFAICSTIIIIILYVHLPETKDKTIQEIGEYFTGKIPPEQQNKTLLEE